LISFVIIIAVAATAATAHILLKIGMNEVGEVNAESIKTPGKLIGQLLTTPAILAAIPVYAISNIGWLVVLSRLNLSVAYPFLASLYIFLPILSMLFLSETISAQHWAGIVVIGIGVGIVLSAGLA
jgi:drug/metabolite transporter (DMT)-like permease